MTITRKTLTRKTLMALCAVAAAALTIAPAPQAAPRPRPLSEAGMSAIFDQIDNPGFFDVFFSVGCEAALDFAPGGNAIRKAASTAVKYAKYIKRKYPLTTIDCFQLSRIGIAVDHANQHIKVYADYQALLSYGLCPTDSEACRAEVKQEIWARRGWKPALPAA